MKNKRNDKKVNYSAPLLVKFLSNIKRSEIYKINRQNSNVKFQSTKKVYINENIQKPKTFHYSISVQIRKNLKSVYLKICCFYFTILLFLIKRINVAVLIIIF